MSLHQPQLSHEQNPQKAPEKDVPSISSSSELGHTEFHLPFDNSKAGLENTDKERIAAIIQEASKGTSYYLNEQRKAEDRNKHVQHLQKKIEFFTRNIAGAANTLCLAQLEHKVAETEAELEACRHFGTYVHVDMDMFYAAVEMKKNPSLASVPLGVGSAAMLSTTNYAARAYGVRSGMPGFIGRRLCPSLVIVPPDFAAYRAEAAAVRAIAAEYDAGFTSVGLDELTMDVAAHLRRGRGGGATTAGGVAAEFRARVHAATGLTASAGIAPTATLAKIASNYDKPNGQHELRLRSRDEVVAFMRTLPVRQVPGIGKSTEYVLQCLGITKLGDIYDRRVELCYIFTEKTFCFLLSSSLGVSGMFDVGDSTEAVRRTEADQKSISQEQTLKVNSSSELQKVAMENLSTVHQKLIDGGMVSAQVVLKIKWTSFRVQQYTRNLLEHSDDMEVLRRSVDELLLPILDRYAMIRLLGVRVSNIITRNEFEETRRRSSSGHQSLLTEYQVRRMHRDAPEESCGFEVVLSSSSTSDDVQCVSPPRKKGRHGDQPPDEEDEGVIVIDD